MLTSSVSEVGSVHLSHIHALESESMPGAPSQTLPSECEFESFLSTTSSSLMSDSRATSQTSSPVSEPGSGNSPRPKKLQSPPDIQSCKSENTSTKGHSGSRMQMHTDYTFESFFPDTNNADSQIEANIMLEKEILYDDNHIDSVDGSTNTDKHKHSTQNVKETKRALSQRSQSRSPPRSGIPTLQKSSSSGRCLSPGHLNSSTVSIVPEPVNKVTLKSGLSENINKPRSSRQEGMSDVCTEELKQKDNSSAWEVNISNFGDRIQKTKKRTGGAPYNRPLLLEFPVP